MAGLGLDIFGDQIDENTPPKAIDPEPTILHALWGSLQEYKFGIGMILLSALFIADMYWFFSSLSSLS